MPERSYGSRKFMLASVAMTASSAALLMGNISGAEYASCIAFILGLYGAADVTEKVQLTKKTNA